MSVSKKQLRANRQNAQKSTGPASPEGKQIASRNPTKHGLYSTDLIVDSIPFKEDEQEYDLLLSALFEELRPQTLFQEYLVRKIANSLWRSRRIIRAETSRINDQLNNVDQTLADRAARDALNYEPEEDNEETRDFHARERANLIGIRSMPPDSACFNILRYEMRLDRQVTRAYGLLVHLQRCRNFKSFNEKGEKQEKVTERTHFLATQSPPNEYTVFSEPPEIPQTKEELPICARTRPEADL